MEVCIVLCIHFRKAEAAYRRPHTLKPWLELYIFQLTYLNDETTALHDAGVVYFTEYLSVLFQLTYLNGLYGECNRTARACMNSGYQALFSLAFHLGTKLLAVHTTQLAPVVRLEMH